MLSVFALSRLLVDGNLGYTPSYAPKNPNSQIEKKDGSHGSERSSGL
jgi:hypothetical protein